MKLSPLATLVLLVTLPSVACVTSSTTATVWTAPPVAPPYARAGHVEWIREVVQRKEGNPVGGALAGAAIGGSLGDSPESALIGLIGGAVIGAAVSQGSSESRIVRGHGPLRRRRLSVLHVRRVLALPAGAAGVADGAGARGALAPDQRGVLRASRRLELTCVRCSWAAPRPG